MYFYIIKTVFKLFKSHKKSKIAECVEFNIEKVTIKIKFRSIFYHLKLAQ